MKNGNPRFSLGAVVLFLMIAACVIPGQTLSPPPTIDPDAVQTSIAATVQAAQSQTAVAQNPLIPLPTGMTGTLIEQAPDGTVKYTDYEGRFEIAFPAGWLALRPNSDEFDAALANEGAVNSMLYEQMTADQAGYEAGFDRLFSYYLNCLKM